MWQSRRMPPLPWAPLRRPVSADVLVVGAGISGAMAADALSEAGLRVVVVDRRQPIGGATVASTSLIQYEIDTPLSVLARDIGVARAQRVWRRSRLAVEALRERVHRLGLDADCHARGSLYLSGSVLAPSALEEEVTARRTAGFEATYLRPAQVRERYGIEGRAAILSHGSLEADPRRLTAGLLNAAVGRGARIHAPVEVARVEPDTDGVTVFTTGSHPIRTAHVVFATGYEIPSGVPRTGHTVVSTWAMATRPQPSRVWRDRCFVWEASEPYLYLRVDPLGRVICGGEDEPFSDEARRDALLPAKTAALERKLARLIPGLDSRAAFAWAGHFGASDTGTPSIGRIPGMPHCYAVLGYGGNGITFSMVAAQLLRSAILGQRDPDADLFRFGRRR